MDLGTGLVAGSLIASLAYVYAPIARVHASRRLHMHMPAGAVAPGADPIVAPPEPLPARIEGLCMSWIDKFAQDAARQRARELYDQLKDWSAVYVVLERES